MTVPAIREQEAEIAPIPADISPSALIYAGIQRGLTPEALEKLVALQERVETRNAAKAFANAMAAFQQECPLIQKSSTAEITTKKGGKFKYTYAELDEIARTIAPYMAKQGLSYTWDTTVNDACTILTCVCTVQHLMGHKVTSSFTLPIDNDSAMSPQQKVGAASTFAQRRTLSAVLGLTTTDEDTDAVKAVDPTPITAIQLMQLEDMIEDAEADRGKYLKYLGIDKLAELPAVHFESAMNVLRQKKAANQQ